MNFPVPSFVVRRNALGADLQTTMAKSAQNLKTAIIKAVVKQAAAQIGVQLVLTAFVPLGTAISALMTVAQLVSGKFYERQMNDVIAQTMVDIKKRAAASEKILQNAAEIVYQQELPAARMLAASGQPLGCFYGMGELGFGFSDVKKAVKKTANKVSSVAKDAVKDVHQALKDPKKQTDYLSIITSPIGASRLALKATENVGIMAARGIESTGAVKKGAISKPLTTVRDKTDDVAKSAQNLTSPITGAQTATKLTAQHTSQAVASVAIQTGHRKVAEEAMREGKVGQMVSKETMTAASPTGAFNLLSGREQLVKAREMCSKMRAKAFADIDKMTKDGLAKMKTQAFHLQVRTDTAKALREDPEFQGMLAEMLARQRAEQAALDAQQKLLEDEVGPIVDKGQGAATLVGVAAAVTGAIYFTH